MKGTLPPAPSTTVKLPVWRSLAEAILSSGPEPGDTYSADWIEGWIRVSHEDEKLKYGLTISKVRQVIEEAGLYIYQKEDGSCIIQTLEFNVSKVRERNRTSIKILKRALVLGNATDATKLDPDHQRILASEVEKSATRLAWAARRSLT